MLDKENQMPKIAILYICTGKYAIFWDEYYASCQQRLFPNSEVAYFVFTDQEINKPSDQIHTIYQERMGWPNDTLLRFQLFSRITDRLASFDYIFFMNANLLVKETISESLLPQKEDLFGVVHPGFYNKQAHAFTYERNPLSTAYIPEDQGFYYFMGGFNGGKAKAFITLIHTLAARIQEDLDQNIIAIWHDESHLNRYFLDHKDTVKVVPPAYGYPEGWDIPFDKKIIILDKTKFGGHAFLRGEKETPINAIDPPKSRFSLKNLFRKRRQ